ncbi:MAG: cell surface protein SprA [Flavobacteriales bacterium]
MNDRFSMGATMLNLRERPLTQKVNIGNEPVNNSIIGTDFKYQGDSQFLTDLVDALPFYETSAASSIDISAEAAYLIPGHSRAIGQDGNAYIDDFEGSQSAIDIRSVNRWFLASTPKLQPNLFPEGNLEDSLIYNYNRAALSWYTVDPQFFRGSGLQDGQVSAEVKSDHRTREVLEGEVFPNRELPTGTPPNIPTLDLTFRPSNRGMYNYEKPEGTNGISAGLTADGFLADPSSRWGGVQRALTTTDFEAANIEYLQFWLMDPFNEDSENFTGGDFYINLGNVSEDVLNDSQLSYENGLPSENNPDLPVVDSLSPWGVYPDPTTFNVVNAFDNSSGNYELQDVGLDGLADADEQVFFSDWLSEVADWVTPDAYSTIVSDPSGDNFRYFRDPQAQANEETILERYERFNGYEDNSNTGSPNGYPITSTTIPNTEDINQDITLSTIESYYQYKVSIRPQDLGEFNIGSNYITDSFEQVVTTANDEDRTIRWYQFKIPVREFESKVGGITDFRSIRFIRMFMTGWSEPVTLRFARLELIRGEWRRYLNSLAGPQEVEPDDPSSTAFTISAVNIEENGNRDPVPYVTPPGIIREIDVGTANQRRLNEQSLEMAVCGLKDGDARGAYRNINFDMRMYKRLRMYVHAEAGPDGTTLNDDDLTCFIRLGNDFENNYYEYEIPLKVTPWNTGDEDLIWPAENNIDIEFRKLQNLKIERPSGFPLFEEYEGMDSEYNARLAVKGNPNLANVVMVMVGVRNPNKNDNVFDSDDDGLDKCSVVWVNEMRLADFNQQGGWAATAQLNAKLADLGNVALAANMSTPGFGGLEQRIQDRQRETIRAIDASGTIQLGKLLPKKLGVTLPMYLGYSQEISTPQFDPLSPDIEMAEQQGLSQERQDNAQSVNQLKSINFSNIKIDPQFGSGASSGSRDRNRNRGGADAGGRGGIGEDKGGKDEKSGEELQGDVNMGSARGGGGGSARGGSSRGGGSSNVGLLKLLDPGNFSANFSYIEAFNRDVNTEFQINREYRGGLNYNFSHSPKNFQPFGKIGFLRKMESMKWLTDFNFYLFPKQFTVGTEMNRIYETSRVRNNTEELLGVETNLLINTQVMKTWQWSRNYALKYDLTRALKFDYNGTAQALVGEPAGEIIRDDAEAYQAYKDSVLVNLQNAGEITTYNHNVTGSYKLPFDKLPIVNFISSDIRYQGSYRWDRAPFSQDSLGHTIQNSRNLSLNAQANFSNLYNKIPGVKDLLNPPRRAPRRNEIRNEDRDGFGNAEDDEKVKFELNPLATIVRLIASVQNVSGTFTRNEGMLLPGYAERARYVGLNEQFTAPGALFVLGHQNTNWQGVQIRDFATEAASNGWLIQQPYQNQQYNQTFQETFNVRANLEPIKHLKIELTANRNISQNYTSFFRFDEELNDFVYDSPNETGQFSATVMSWNTAFVEDDIEDEFNSENWSNFLLYRLQISNRLNESSYQLDEPENTGYYVGWGATSQDVTIPAFISAYLGLDPKEVPLDVFNTPVAPNWRVTYDGLTKNEFFKQYFKRFNLNHSYRSTLTTNYVTNLNYTEDESGLPTAFDQSAFGNYISERQFNVVSLSEQLSPLIGVDMTIKTEGENEPQLKVELKRDRNVAFGLTNFQITETKSQGLVIGFGYKFKDVPNPFIKTYGKLPVQMLKETDLVLRADLNVRDNRTIIRKMEERQNQVTAGQNLVSIKMSADLEVSDKLTMRAFYDHQITNPYISTSFATSNIRSGVALRFNLNQ